MSWTHERKEVHKTTVTHVGLNMFRFNKRFREIRTKDKGCKLCHKPFIDEQFVHIAFTDKGNKLLCDSCSDKAIKGGATFVDKNPNIQKVECTHKHLDGTDAIIIDGELEQCMLCGMVGK